MYKRGGEGEKEEEKKKVHGNQAQKKRKHLGMETVSPQC
jgi:hypothetical protein